jgi:hypothetical protein
MALLGLLARRVQAQNFTTNDINNLARRGAVAMAAGARKASHV